MLRLPFRPAKITRSVLRAPIRLPLIMVGRMAVLPARWPHRMPRYARALQPQLKLTPVSEPGFDAAGREMLADSAWSMTYFQPDGADHGHIYVGTNNNIIGLSLCVLGRDTPANASRPPEIRRYRPDLGSLVWESVLNYAAYEDSPYDTVGFRTMTVYRIGDKSYLYAGTAAHRHASVWRTANGVDWEQVFVFPYDEKTQIGSVRGMVVHDGLLYISTTRSGDILPGGTGQMWATDGSTFTPVVLDGFGNPNNTGISILESFAGYIYAGTYNAKTGYEVWKLRGVGDTPTPVIRFGAGRKANEAVLSMRVFKDHLYIGSGIPLGFNPITRRGPKGCTLVRVDQHDHLQVIVGNRRHKPLSGYGPGFGWYLNAYCWYMREHEGHLYVGTWDISRTLMFVAANRHLFKPSVERMLSLVDLSRARWGSPPGGDLYRTADGIRFEPVFLDGMGNPDNHGIRTLESTPEGLYIGTENPFSRLEVWRLEQIE